MSRKVACLVFGFFLSVGLLSASAQATGGFGSALQQGGVDALGNAVKNAAETVYAGDPEAVEQGLIGILDAVESLNNSEAMSAAIVAVLMAGGSSRFDVAQRAVNRSQYGQSNATGVASIVASVQQLLNANGGTGTSGTQGTTVTIDGGNTPVPQPITPV